MKSNSRASIARTINAAIAWIAMACLIECEMMLY
jgi:hypothetical protein